MNISSSNPFPSLEWDGRRVLWVHSERIAECMEHYREHGYNGVAISPHMGCSRRDIAFLDRHPYVESVVMPSAKGIDVSSLASLHDLRYLSLAENRQPIDFRIFPKLKELRVEWHPKMRLPESGSELETLHLRRYRSASKDLTGLPGTASLVHMELVQSPLLSLDGIERFAGLVALELSYLAKLETINGIAALKKLESLTCVNCPRISDYDTITGVRALKVLRIHRCASIPSLKILKGLHSLEDVRFMGTDVLDGDMTPLLKLPKLAGTAFTNKRHFTHTCENVQHVLNQRGGKGAPPPKG